MWINKHKKQIQDFGGWEVLAVKLAKINIYHLERKGMPKYQKEMAGGIIKG